ncbi:MAG: 7TM-DISM domain-containing protein, partial [Curvibacter sp.]
MMPTLCSVLRRWRAAVLGLLARCRARAWAGDLVVERAWLEDPGGQLSWEEVQQRPMMPLQGVLSRGYGQAPLWMRLRIDPSAQDLGDDRRLYLRIRPMYLDEIVLFDPLQQPARQPPVGDRYPVSAQAEPATTFLLELPIGQGPRDVWLRVQTTSTRLIYADVFTPADLRRVDALINHLGALYLGLIVMFFLWGLLQLLMRPEPLMFSFLLYQGSWLLMGTSFLGYPYLYLSNRLPPGVVDQATNIAIVFSSASALLFSHFVLNELGSARWRRNVLTLIIIIIFSLLVAALGGYASTALKLNMLLVLLVPPTMWALAVMSKPAAHWYRSLQGQVLSKAVVVGYFSMLVVFTVLTA